MYQNFDNRKNEEYLDAFKQKVAEQKIATMEERRNEMARSRNNFLGTLAGAVLAIAVGWFILMPQYQQTNKDVPTIRRSQTAVKVKPENPGGMEIPNQDKDVYNLVEKKEVDNTVVENLLPTPEQPKLPDIVPETVDANADNIDELVDEVADEADDAVPNKPEDLLSETASAGAEDVKAAEEKAKETEEKAKAEAKAAEEKAKESEEKAKSEAKAAEEKAKAEAKAAEEKAKAEAKAAESAVKSVAGGKWQVQFVASKNRDAVEKTWTSLTQKYSMLKAYPHEVQTADLGAQGVVYRLRAGSFATREEAAKVCNDLKAKGMNDCIVKER